MTKKRAGNVNRKKTSAMTRTATIRAVTYGRDPAEIKAIAQKMRPKRRRPLGGVSDLHIEMQETEETE